ncbi:MAG: hypothetical protein WCL50_04930 [Spirochaetota bacterium]
MMGGSGELGNASLKHTTVTTMTTANLAAVPRSITVDIPSSLLQSPTGARGLMGTTAWVDSSGMRHQMGGHDFSPGMGGHFWIGSGLWDTQLRLAKAARTLVLLDKVIADAKLEPSTSTIAGSTVTWTEEMVVAYSALLPSSFASSAAFKAAAGAPAVGSTSRIPDFVYSLVPATDTLNSPSYAKMVALAKASDDNNPLTSDTLTLYWSEDRGKFKFDHQVTEGSEVTDSTFVAYDSSGPTMAAGRVDAHGTMTVAIKADSTATATHGTFLTYDASILQGDADSTLAADGSVAISAEGYADDQGGSLTDTITVTSGSTAKVYYLKEDFDGNGRLTGLSYSVDGSTWTAFMSAPLLPATGYRMKVDIIGMPGNGGMGGMGGEVRHEMQGHGGGMPAGPPRLYDISDASITTGVWVAAKDSAFATIIGTGVSREKGRAWLTFSTLPTKGDSWYLAPLGASGTADTTKSLPMVW